MLVLTRKVGQSITIDDEIEVEIIESKGDKIKIGIKAPKRVSVHRTEVHKEIERQNQEALDHRGDIKMLLKKLRKD
ncbi:carbon storage regulator CsrA [Proteinivorax tanatarense]|uniref:Translational regulator CsrA n=1 Tax=Proteinivorax tanatarense TaxID=1260629 RepID=A0AAU7VMV0_9FIRM